MSESCKHRGLPRISIGVVVMDCSIPTIARDCSKVLIMCKNASAHPRFGNCGKKPGTAARRVWVAREATISKACPLTGSYTIPGGERANSPSVHAKLAVSHYNSDEQYTYGELSKEAHRLASILMEHGISRGDRIAILSESRPAWVLVFLACSQAGATVVPLDARLTEQELQAILSDAEPRFLFASGSFSELARKLYEDTETLRRAYSLDPVDSDHVLVPFRELQPRELLEPRSRHPDETAILIYTSGTMGRQKGVMTTFGNLSFQISRFEQLMGNNGKDVFVSVLPLNHLFEMTVGFLGVLYAGGEVCYCPSLFPRDILDTMARKQVTCMITVPLFLALLKKEIYREIAHGGLGRRILFKVALRVSTVLPGTRVRRVLFRRLHREFGGRLRFFVTGGAPMGRDVLGFFNAIGCPVYQGYGLTETSPVISTNCPGRDRVGSVGQPLPGVEVRIVDHATAPKSGTGEIVTRGRHVMKGYFKQPDLTAEVIDADGWLHTGDLGRIDNDGFLFVTGRLKNIIVLPSGKNVQTEEVEEAVARSLNIKECCVVGHTVRGGLTDGGEEICIVVVPSDECIEAAGESSEQLEKRLCQEVYKYARTLAGYKRPTRVLVSRNDLPKTSTRKIRRILVSRWVTQQLGEYR